MNKDTIKEKIEALYINPKSKNFLTHLIKAYFPIENVVKVNDKPKNGNLICVLTNKRLVSINDFLLTKETEDFKLSLDTNLKTAIENGLEPKAFNKEFNGKTIGFTGDKTTTFISYLGLQVLNEWINEKIKSKDKAIVWLVGNISNKPNPKSEYQNKIFAKTNGYRKPSTTFGDLESLQKLKLKFKKEGY